MTYTVRDLITARLKERKRKEKPYKPEAGYKRINGVDIILKTEIGEGFEVLEHELEDMRKKNKEMFRTLADWNELIIILKAANEEIKEFKREREKEYEQ